MIKDYLSHIFIRKIKNNIQKLFFYFVFVSLIFALSNLKNLFAFAQSLKEILTPPISSIVYDRNGKVIGYLYKDQFRLYAKYEEIPPFVIKALIATEDERFFKHGGIDLKGIARAAFENLKNLKIKQGGSTITQQLVKMVFLSPKRTISRKLKEIVLAQEIEKKLSKKDILELYLNYAYFGEGAYGIKTAAWVYFGKDLKNLTLPEAALLIGLIRAPAYYNPFRHPEKAIKRRNIVLTNMYKLGFINLIEYTKAVSSPLGILKKPNRPKNRGYILDYIKKKLKALLYDDLVIYQGGLKIYTTVDLRLQNLAQNYLKNYVNKLAKKHNISDLQGAAFGINKKGQILFMVGGKDYKETQFNRVYQAKRPIGSTIKPFIYLEALKRNFNYTTLLADTPISFKLTNNRFWTPLNYEKRFHGPIKLKNALIYSINVATIHLALDLGPGDVYQVLRKYGFVKKYFDLSYVLGACQSNLWNLLRNYEVFANKGIIYEPYIIEEIKNFEGKTVYKHKLASIVMENPRNIKKILPLLAAITKYGTAKRLKYLWRYFPVYGKTGTTNAFRDTYFVGWTPKFLMGIWIGRDSYKSLWKGATGGNTAAPLWGLIAKKIYFLL